MRPRRAGAHRTSLVLAILAAIAAQLVAVVPAFASGLPAECDLTALTVTCTYTSGDNLFTVPTGVTSIHVVATGGRGGNPIQSGSVPGYGATVTADLAVTPGDSLHAVVGGNGGPVSNPSGAGATAGANGGGEGGATLTCHGAGGGGASDIRTDATLASRVLVAGGGGGVGCLGLTQSLDPAWFFSSGGDAGAPGDPPGTWTDPYAGRGGLAGCATASDTDCGTGGAAGTAFPDGMVSHPGTDGALGIGGGGGDFVEGGGGGGGGGLYGGGGGGAGGELSPELGEWGSAGGGGGGSNLVPAGGTASVDTTGVPVVTIAYADPAATVGIIAFTSTRDGNAEIYLMHADGSAPTNLTNNAAADSDPAWSPDGTKIAFVSDREGKSAIYVMNADGTNPTRITPITLTILAGDSQPAWSPDGTRVAFTHHHTTCLGLCTSDVAIDVVNADGTGLVTLTTDGNFIETGHPAWSPDGLHIAFDSTRSGGLQVYVMDPDGSNPTGLGVAGTQPAWSPDGSKIAYNAGGTGALSVMHADGTNAVSLGAAGANPTWSPDGTQIAFDSTRDGTGTELYAMAADGFNQTRLTTNAAADEQPAWLPTSGSGGGGGDPWSLTSGVDAATVTEGTDAGFTVTLDNPTGDALTTVAIGATLTGGLGIDWSLAADSGAGWSITGTAPNQTLTFPAGTLAAGSSTTAHVTSATAGDSCGTYDLDATLTSDQGGAQTSASLAIDGCFVSVDGSVTPDAASVSAGSQAGFTVQVDNVGTIAFDSIDLTDVLPAGTGISWSLANDSDSGWSISGSAPNQSLTYTPDVLAAGASTSAHVVSATTQASCGTYEDDLDVIATGGGGQSEATPTGSLEVVDCHPAPIAEITGDATCATFAAGTAPALSGIDYKVRNGTITLLNTAPGRLFYWVQADATAGANSLTVGQSITTGNFAKLFALAKGSAVYGASCTAVKSTFSQASDGSVTVRWQARTAGPFIVKVSYAPKSVVGQPAPTPSTVSYAFATTGIAGSTVDIDLRRR